MSDITKCYWEWCPLKENCYRYTAKRDELCQVYFIGIPFKNECEFFWDNNNSNVKIFNDDNDFKS